MNENEFKKNFKELNEKRILKIKKRNLIKLKKPKLDLKLINKKK